MNSTFDSGEQMSLNGNLEVFPLEEVLRLLARSRKSGCLRVESAGVQGRVYLTSGALALATTASDSELRNRLVSSGLVEESEVRKIELSGASVTDALSEDVSANAWADFVREESVEGLYRIRKSGRGTFDFVVELAPRYPTGQSFDSEVILSEADRRSLEWDDISSVLPNLDQIVRMVPVLSNEESVTLSPSTWQILASLGGGSSTAQVAQTIGWSDFRTAREMATLVRNGLVLVSEDAAATPAVVAEVEDEVDMAPAPDEPAEAEGAPSDDVETEVQAEADVAEEDAAPEVGDDVQAEDAATETDVEADIETEAVIEEEATEETPVEVADTEEAWAAAAVETSDEAGAETESAQTDESTETEAESSSWWSDEPLSAEVPDDEPETPWGSSPWSADEPAEEPSIQPSPWAAQPADAESGPEPEAAGEGELEPAEAVAEAASSEGEGDRTGGWWAEAMGDAEPSQSGNDNEADRFLESVFSSLSDDDDAEAKPEKEEDETGFGMGLLRRRRMGAAARDISDNDR